MVDIVDRLRLHSGRAIGHWEDYANKTDSVTKDAADEIERLRGELTVAFLSQAPQTKMVVKPLEWKETHEGTGHYATAKSLIGGYDVFHLSISVRGDQRDIYGWTGHWVNGDRKADSFDEAKAAAQADYERRVASCVTPIVSVTPPEGMSPSLYRTVHDAAVEAYESATPSHFRYSAAALRKAVDAGLRAASSNQIPPPQTNLQGIEEGIERAARYIEKQRDDYVEEFGNYDPSTGVTEFSTAGEEHLSTLEELIEGIRALHTATSEGQP